MWTFNSLRTICWKEDYFPTELPGYLCQKPVNHDCTGLFLDSQLYPIAAFLVNSSFTLHCAIRSYSSSNFVLFQNHFNCCKPFAFLYDLGDWCVHVYRYKLTGWLSAGYWNIAFKMHTLLLPCSMDLVSARGSYIFSFKIW